MRDGVLRRKVSIASRELVQVEVSYAELAAIGAGESYTRVCDLCGVQGILYAQEITNGGVIRSVYVWHVMVDGVATRYEAIFENDSLVNAH